jgi:small subunit ribosomal protein S17|uniref:Small ribosomal subunit protein uS17c n=2 Tax=Cyanidioschyzon merolae TaxID=45157 RepID=RR17_CYAM1|nr:ribosomal protein S17 [Cyanidioschyzon merolae strain 10D]Q85FV4.1 RecName: Full=Small ribosomal subunit protein uS17c; AltName: Full=30S ribosomal protein S17, chloroplastic [Cyanidioschyzon merolae strain 10D]QFV17029.1 30S ribosomal protein S17 [Cyanidioschyzon merolae]QFV17204.1 30S ribosomal protein S17 [Cyanidioschyzon merolae]BAC76240.1 30S ribosomal protein S17 [Cyanidioschyzon merolae strain 10D]
MKKLLGLVVSCRMQKTVIVEVKTQVKHALYGKRIMKKKRYAVHDPEKKASLGELIWIRTCRPISKTKKWIYDSSANASQSSR